MAGLVLRVRSNRTLARMISLYQSSALLLLCLSGCASRGFNRSELKEQFDLSAVRSLEKSAALNQPQPVRLGVYFRAAQGSRGEADWGWTDQDRSLFEEIGHELKSEGVVSEVFPIIGSDTDGRDLKSIQRAAARYRADVVLLVSGSAQVERSINGLGLSYVLLLPALFVPGSRADTLFLGNAALLDVRTERLYLAAESEGVASESYVAAFSKKDGELISQAKAQALTNLQDEVRRRIREIQHKGPGIVSLSADSPPGG